MVKNFYFSDTPEISINAFETADIDSATEIQYNTNCI